MRLDKVLRRFLLPGAGTSLYYFKKYRALVSPRAEVEWTPNVILGKGTQIGSFTKVKASLGPLTIGRDVEISSGCFLAAEEGGIEIGDDCLIGPNVVIVGNSYRHERLDVPIRKQGKTSRGIRIADNVWIGANSSILDGAEIASGVIVAANSVVRSSIPENVIVAGSPADIVSERKP